VINMECESRNRVKQYWDVKGSSFQEKAISEMNEYQKKIEKLKRA
jgi:hypothetical protein